MERRTYLSSKITLSCGSALKVVLVREGETAVGKTLVKLVVRACGWSRFAPIRHERRFSWTNRLLLCGGCSLMTIVPPWPKFTLLLFSVVARDSCGLGDVPPLPHVPASQQTLVQTLQCPSHFAESGWKTARARIKRKDFINECRHPSFSNSAWLQFVFGSCHVLVM